MFFYCWVWCPIFSGFIISLLLWLRSLNLVAFLADFVILLFYDLFRYNTVFMTGLVDLLIYGWFRCFIVFMAGFVVSLSLWLGLLSYCLLVVYLILSSSFLSTSAFEGVDKALKGDLLVKFSQRPM